MSTAIPAAISLALRPLYEGPAVALRVLAAFPEACYLQPVSPTGLGPGAPPLVTLAARGSVVHPNAVVLPDGVELLALVDPRGGRRGAHRTGAALVDAALEPMVAWLGDGRLVAGDAAIRPSRWWDPVPTLPVAPPVELVTRRADELLAELRGAGLLDVALSDRLDPVVGALQRGDVDAATHAGRALVGFGPGLTPSGDDALSGMFVTACLLGRGHLDGAQWTAVSLAGQRLTALARDATTSVAHASLWHATRGEAAGPVASMLRALAGRGRVGQALPALLAVGSTSGRDLALGLLAGARLVTGSPGAPPRHEPTSDPATRATTAGRGA